MRLIYTQSKAEVKVGDVVTTSRNEVLTVTYFRQPTSPASSGKVSVKSEEGWEAEYYVSIIGAEWIEREDRQ